MRYLKSVLFIVLVSVFAVQANANVLLPTASMQVIAAPANIIEVVHHGHNVEVTNITNEGTELTLICPVNGEILTDFVKPDGQITLSDLASGSYELHAVSTLGSEVVSIIIL